MRRMTVFGVLCALFLGFGVAGAANAEDDESLLAGHGQQKRPITLHEAVQMAVRANLALKAGALDPAIAMESYRANASIFDPLVSAGFEYGHVEQPVTSAFFGKPVVTDDTIGFEGGVSKLLRTGGTVSFLYQADRLDTDSAFITLNPSWTQGTTFRAEQPLLRGAGYVVMNDILLAKNGITIAQQNQRTLVEQTLLDVVTAYWELVLAQDQVATRVKSEEVAAELLRDAEARLEAKVGTPLGVAEARAGLERRRGDRIAAMGARGQAQDRLRALVMPFAKEGTESLAFVATDIAREDEGMAPEVSHLERYVRLATANRPEIRASKANLENRQIDLYSAANAVKPQLDLVATVGGAGLSSSYGDSFGDMATFEALTGTIGVQFSMFIGQRAARANLRLAEWARRQATINIQELENQVIRQVRSTIREVVTARAVEKAALAEVEAAQEGLRGERHLLDNGLSTPFRVLEKEFQLTEARLRVNEASARRRIAEASFWRAIGFLSQTLGLQGRVVGGSVIEAR